MPMQQGSLTIRFSVMETIDNSTFFAEVERLVAEGSTVRVRVKGNSMRPLMRSDRTQVLLAPVAEGELRCGDIVLFRYRGSHVMHRIRRIEGDSLTMEGDGNYRAAEHAVRADVVARVEAVVTHGGRRIECSSREWRLKSALWLSLPRLVRRYALALAWRLGIR